MSDFYLWMRMSPVSTRSSPLLVVCVACLAVWKIRLELEPSSLSFRFLRVSGISDVSRWHIVHSCRRSWLHAPFPWDIIWDWSRLSTLCWGKEAPSVSSSCWGVWWVGAPIPSDSLVVNVRIFLHSKSFLLDNVANCSH